MAVALAIPVATQAVQAQGYDGSSSIAQAEIARRAALVESADKALLAGRKAYASGDYEKSVEQYRTALNLLPPGPALSDRRNAYAGHLGDASLALSMKYQRVGKYSEARSLLESVKAKDPGNLQVAKNLEYLDDPIRLNPALNYEHTQNVDKVRKHLFTARGYYDLAKFDEANAEYQKVLRIDPYNTAARRGMEVVNVAQSRYYRSAYDHTRSEMLKEVDAAWEMSVPTELPSVQNVSITSNKSTGVQYIQRKLNNIIIPSVDFGGSTVEEALGELKLRARELDSEPNDANRGVNFVIKNPIVTNSGAEGETAVTNVSTRRISELSLDNIPLGKLLEYIADATNLQIKIDDFVVTFSDKNNNSTELNTRSFIVPPDFISQLSAGSGGASASDDSDPFGSGSDGGSSFAPSKKPIELLKESGISFPGNSAASYIASANKLTVTNTLANLDSVEELIDAMRVNGHKQVKVSSKFVEISQNNTDELGYDWAITGDIGAGSSVIRGGSLGNGSALNATDFGGGFDPINGGTITAGNRTGSFAVTDNSIDSIINNPSRNETSQTAAPGILSVAGIFGEDQVQAVLRGLNQKRGTDIMTAPSVLAPSGGEASINVIREFIYPSEYEPPELPQNVGSQNTGNNGVGIPGLGGGANISTFPVTPATPTAFETRNTGVSLLVKPTIGASNYTIDLNFIPEITEFEGFINYGSPIQSAGTNALGNPVSVTITENRIEMPVFSTRRVETTMNIYDGYTVAVGGLIREDVQSIEDKVPILGDLPIIGRLFQTKAENRIKSNLIIFVKAEIVDPAGLRVNQPRGSSAASSVSDGVLPPLPGQ